MTRESAGRQEPRGPQDHQERMVSLESAVCPASLDPLDNQDPRVTVANPDNPDPPETTDFPDNQDSQVRNGHNLRSKSQRK